MIVIALLAQAARVIRSGEQPSLANSTIDAGGRLGLVPAGPVADFPLSFNAAACEGQIRIDILYLDGRTDEEAHEAAGAQWIVRYVYLGSVRDRQDLSAMRARWLLANALFVSGLRSVRPGMEILSVVIPGACPGLADLDWARLSPW
jgi:hypothetical protein